jgi:hypothetical protein
MAVAAGAVGTIAAVAYHRAGLSLSHYDARAHLVVARRILDSLTPGWEQVGAVWLPLPHLLNAVPVQLDLFYRSGASAVAISVLSFTAAVYAVGGLVTAATGSRAGGVAASAALMLNPTLLYLQSTPMTEPLLIGLTTTGLLLAYRWVEAPGATSAVWPGLVLGLACLTRYEAWPVTAAAVALSFVVLWRRDRQALTAIRQAARLAGPPVAAIVLFLLLSRATVGEWFVTGGFFVPDNPARGLPAFVAIQVLWGLRQLSGNVLTAGAAAGLVLLLTRVLRERDRSTMLLLLAGGAAAALPAYAFFGGHPFRIRYMASLVPVCALLSGVAVGLLPRWRAAAASVLVIGSALAVKPWDQRSPMILEAQWDRPWSARRTPVTGCLSAAHRSGQKVLASMGSLAHYMQETSRAGFGIRDYVHEGNGVLWTESLVRPDRHVDWILIEEIAEGGDLLSARSKEQPDFLRGFDRVCEGGGLALYKRAKPAAPVLSTRELTPFRTSR